MDSVHNADASFLKSGSSVVVKGNCTGFNKDEMGLGSDVILNRCAVITKKTKVRVMKKPEASLLVLWLVASATFAQGKYFTKTGTISIFSSTSLEDIAATNKRARRPSWIPAPATFSLPR